jgi:hypothetical protein
LETYETANFKSMKQLPNSMMPKGLMEGMTKDEAVNLVEYLVGLKKK